MYDAVQLGTTIRPLTRNISLAAGEGSVWGEYFENAALNREIAQDVERTYPGESNIKSTGPFVSPTDVEHDFFREQRVRDALQRILLVYAREAPHVAYKQGMHELWAPIFLLVSNVPFFSCLLHLFFSTLAIY